MPDSIEPKQAKKNQPPEIILAVEVLARVQKDAPEIAQAWRKILPALALHMVKAGQTPDADYLERIVRENHDASKTESLFRATAAETTKPAKLTYESVVAAFPKVEEKIAPEAEWTLSDAATIGRLDKVQELIAAGADIHVRDDLALRNAAWHGHLEIVKYLLEKDGEKACIHAYGEETLRLAVAYRHLEIVKYLLEKDGEKADIHARNDAALYTAARNGYLEIAKYLLEKDGEKADIHAYHGCSLHIAAENDHLGIVKYLLEKDSERADIHAKNDYALRLAANNGHLEIVTYLLKKDGEKADIHASYDDALRSALLSTDGRGYFETAHYLLAQGADRRILNPHQEWKIKEVSARIERWRKVARRYPPNGLGNCDPEGINLSALSACADMLRREGYQTEVANKYAYQTARLFGDEQQVLKYLERWGSAGKQPLHDVVQMIDCPQRKEPADLLPVWDRKAWADAVMAQGPKMAKLVKFASRVGEGGKPFIPVRAKTNSGADGAVSLHLTIQAAAQFAYKNSKENPEFAAICFTHLVDEKNFEAGIKIINETPKDLVKNIPDIAIAGEEFGMQGAHFRRLAPHDSKGLLLGEYTDCCQSIGGAGTACAKHGYQSPDGGFYVVENAKGEIVGQTWAWRGTKEELVLDSLETLGKHVSTSAWKKLATAFAAKLAEDPENNITSLHIGTGGGTPRDMGLETAAQSAQPKAYSGYRDSSSQFGVATFAPGQAFKTARSNRQKNKSPEFS